MVRSFLYDTLIVFLMEGKKTGIQFLSIHWPSGYPLGVKQYIVLAIN